MFSSKLNFFLRLWRNEVAQKKRERQTAQEAREKELKKFGMLRAMAAPMANVIQVPVNFTNILQAPFTRADPKSTKRY